MSVLDKFLDAIKLNDEYDDDDFFDEDFEDDFEEETTQVFRKIQKKKMTMMMIIWITSRNHRFQGQKHCKIHCRIQNSHSQDIFFLIQDEPSAGCDLFKITPMRSARKGQNVNMEVCVIKPPSMEDTREIADTLVDNSTVVLNLEGLDVEVAQRIIDFQVPVIHWAEVCRRFPAIFLSSHHIMWILPEFSRIF